MRKGRKPAGSKLVEGLPGSEFAKKRLQQILKSLSGESTIEEACEALQISRSRFFELRQLLLTEMVDRLEPRPAGRPALPKNTEVTELALEIQRLELQLKTTEVRAELNQFLPLYGRKKNQE